MLELMSSKEVCNLLGISYPTLDKVRRYEECPLPFGRAGRAYRYERDKVLAWLEENALLDPNRPLRPKLDHERRSVVTVAGPSEMARVSTSR